MTMMIIIIVTFTFMNIAGWRPNVAGCHCGSI